MVESKGEVDVKRSRRLLVATNLGGQTIARGGRGCREVEAAATPDGDGSRWGIDRGRR